MNSAKQQFQHISVLPEEAIVNLNLSSGMTVVDVTAGGGGHLRLIAEAVGRKGKVIALDRDLRAHEKDAAGGLLTEFPNISLHHAQFSALQNILQQEGIAQVDGLLCDLGISSPQIDDSSRGFSFMRDGPLDMRMDASNDYTVMDLLKESSEEELANIIYQFGEERMSRRIAHLIKKNWPIPNSTLALAELVAKACGGKRGKTNPATRTFQALRIAVNQELDELHALLNLLPHILAPKARAVFISFHSLEDRQIKICFKKGATKTSHAPIWRLIHKKPLTPSFNETKTNPRARSAKLRVIEKLDPNPDWEI
ncbi:MAG: 16S rRNA (cytosine(1402)-N(4))-methyltransferase RsmH [bacterium]|nr:16S rRNA (cytosine(1402)-N(4))-methyltransferase RsmH [bacterium]